MIDLKVISPEDELFHGIVEAVFLPGTLGEFEVLPHHAPIASSLEEGTLRYRMMGRMYSISIASVFMRFTADQIMVCVEPR